MKAYPTLPCCNRYTKYVRFWHSKILWIVHRAEFEDFQSLLHQSPPLVTPIQDVMCKLPFIWFDLFITERLNERVLTLVSKSYSNIKTEEFSKLIGMSEQEAIQGMQPLIICYLTLIGTFSNQNCNASQNVGLCDKNQVQFSIRFLHMLSKHAKAKPPSSFKYHKTIFPC